MDLTFLHDDELEMIVLGSMITDKQCALEGVSLLEIDDFFSGNRPNREVFKAMKELDLSDSSIDAANVTAQLKQNKVYDEIGGFDFLASLIDSVTIYQNFDEHVRKLQEFKLLRKLVGTCEEIVDDATKKSISSINEFLAVAEKNVSDITSKRSASNFKSAGEIAKVIGTLIQKSKSNVEGLSTGFSDLDNLTGGFGKGQLIVVAARPGMGKSMLALNICYNIAKRTNKTIAYFSLEMSNEELMRRLFAIVSGVSQGRINFGYFSSADKVLLKDAENEISKTNLFFEESTAISIDDIVAKCRKLKEQRGDLSLVVIDHIGIIQEGPHKFNSDQEKIAYFSRKLKSLALELGIPVIIVAHINRGAEKKESRIPELSELRGSGQIENDCDKALLLYRQGYYQRQGINVKVKKGFGDAQTANPKDEEVDEANKDDNTGEKMDIIVAKNRQGKTGKISLLFFPSTGRFSTAFDKNFDDSKYQY